MISLTSNLLGTKRAGERGQISIFFASSLIVLISIIAFVINIGLFVKAKINLQNATDASAYAGAAVQARMLNRIGFMNWEMRNNYKEWMFKYYVLGNLNIDQRDDTYKWRLDVERLLSNRLRLAWGSELEQVQNNFRGTVPTDNNVLDPDVAVHRLHERGRGGADGGD